MVAISFLLTLKAVMAPDFIVPLPPHNQLILIGKTRKSFGLTGEMKVTPETDDIDRHSQLQTVYFQQHAKSPVVQLSVRSSRLHQSFWYLKFDGYNTPESLKPLCGGLLLIHKSDRSPLPENMVYMGDVVGFSVATIQDKVIGKVAEVMEKPGQDLLIVHLDEPSPSAEMMIPWIDVFVKKIDTDNQLIVVDISQLMGVE